MGFFDYLGPASVAASNALASWNQGQIQGQERGNQQMLAMIQLMQQQRQAQDEHLLTQARLGDINAQTTIRQQQADANERDFNAAKALDPNNVQVKAGFNPGTNWTAVLHDVQAQQTLTRNAKQSDAQAIGTIIQEFPDDPVAKDLIKKVAAAGSIQNFVNAPDYTPGGYSAALDIAQKQAAAKATQAAEDRRQANQLAQQARQFGVTSDIERQRLNIESQRLTGLGNPQLMQRGGAFGLALSTAPDVMRQGDTIAVRGLKPGEQTAADMAAGQGGWLASHLPGAKEAGQLYINATDPDYAQYKSTVANWHAGAAHAQAGPRVPESQINLQSQASIVTPGEKPQQTAQHKKNMINTLNAIARSLPPAEVQQQESLMDPNDLAYLRSQGYGSYVGGPGTTTTPGGTTGGISAADRATLTAGGIKVP